MALQTKEFIGSTSDSQRWTWKIIVYEESASIVNKTSTIKIESYIGRPSGQSTSYFGGSATFGFQAGDSSYSHQKTGMYETDIPGGGWRLVDSHTFTVSNTGTKANPTSIIVKGTMSGASFNPNSASASGTFTLTALHDGPVFSSMQITENASVLQNISLASNHFVPYLSNKTIEITASASDGASITQYKIINGTTQFTSTTNTLTLNFANVDMYYYYETSVSRYIPQIIIELTDSLGGVSSYNYTNTYYDSYEKPNLIVTSSSVKRNGQLTGKAKLNINGTYANVTIGNKANSISYFRYRYWKTNASEPSSWFNIPYSSGEISGGNINKYDWEVSKYVNDTWTPIEDVDSESAYYFKVNIEDGFSQSSTITLTCPRGEYIRALLKDRVDFKEISIGKSKILSQLGQSIRIKMSASQVINRNIMTKVNVDTVDYNNSNSLTFSDNKVYIGKGINAVLVNCRYTAWGSNTGGRYIYVYKNGSNFAFNNRSYSQTMETTAVVPVEENDYIEMYCYNEQSDTFTLSVTDNQTFLQVTIIG